MKPQGFLALIRLLVMLTIEFCKHGHGSFKVWFERKDARTIRVIVELEAVRGTGPGVDVGTALEKLQDLLQNPLLLYESGSLETKRLVLERVFTSPLVYERGKGFGTCRLSLPYLLSERFTSGNSIMVDPTGFEPVTSSVQTRRSTR